MYEMQVRVRVHTFRPVPIRVCGATFECGLMPVQGCKNSLQ
jgi:hypothetical protein